MGTGLGVVTTVVGAVVVGLTVVGTEVGAVVETVVGRVPSAITIRSRICLSPPNRTTRRWVPAGSVTEAEIVRQPWHRLFGTAMVVSGVLPPSRRSEIDRPSAQDATEAETVYTPERGTATV